MNKRVITPDLDEDDVFFEYNTIRIYQKNIFIYVLICINIADSDVDEHLKTM